MIQESDVGTTLPTHPQLRPYLDCYPTEDGRFVIEASGTEQHWIFKGKHAAHVLQPLVPFLDGCHSIEALAEQSPQRLEHIRAALAMLQKHGLLMEEHLPAGDFLGESTGTELDTSIDLFQNQSAYFARFPAQAPQKIQRRLAETQVTFVGLAPLGMTLLALLARAGIGRIVAIDHHLITAADVGSTPLLRRDEIGQPRSEAAQRLIAQVSPAITYKGYTHSFETAETLAAAFTGSHMAVVSAMSFAPRTRELVNEAALKAGIPHLGVELRGVEGWVGPTVLPGTSPCYHCFLVREQAGSPITALARGRTHWYFNGGEEQATLGYLDAAVSLLAGMVATEALHVLAGEPAPLLMGKLFRVDLVKLRVSGHRLLRLPACPQCDQMALKAGEDVDAK